jgi:uncharacterized protein YcnI
MRIFETSLALAIVLVVSSAEAHVRVQPVESQVGAQQTYTVRVPTEGDVATNSIELEVPDGVSVISIEGQADTKKSGARIVSIIWKVEIPPGQSREFTFVATNPSSGPEIAWKAHQHHVDGSTIDWIDTPTSRRPASITKLRAAPGR